MPRLLRAALLTGLIALIALATALPAQAHTELIGTSPGRGKTVPEPPAIVALQFSQQVLELGALVQVTGPSGRVEEGKPKLAGAAVVQELDPGLPAGNYTVAWRVTSPDGHPIEGRFTFTAKDAGEAAQASPSASAVAVTPSAAPLATPTAAGQLASGGQLEPVASNDSPNTGWTIAGIAIVVAGLGAGLVALRRPRRSPATSLPPGSNQPPAVGPTAPPSD